jgi:hypothetical protein
MTTIRRIPTSKIDGNSSNSTTADEIRPYGEIAVYINTDDDQDNKLELLIFDGERTHLKSKVLSKGTFYGGDADSGDGLNRDTIKLIPDAELHRDDSDYGNDQYVIIDPTIGNPVGHIHIRAGGTINQSTADIFLGGENNNVRVSDTDDRVTISTDAGEGGTPTWTFDNDGSLTLPRGYFKNDTSDGFLTIEGPLFADMVSAGEGAYNTISNGVEIVTHGVGTDTERKFRFSWDGSLYMPTASDNSQVGAIEWRIDGGIVAQVKSSPGGGNPSSPKGLRFLTYGGDTATIISAGFTNNWTFREDGSLTIPGDIRSEGNINIEINLADSTLRRWQFGEDGNTEFPGNITVGNLTIGDNKILGSNQEVSMILDPGANKLIIGPGTWDGSGYDGLTFTHNADYSRIQVTGNDTGGATRDLEIIGGVNLTLSTNWSVGSKIVLDPDGDGIIELNANTTIFGILKIDDGVHEKFQTKADATGTVTHDCASGHIFYHTSPDANWTANFTNLNLSTGYVTAVSLIIVQGATGYYPTVVQIGGVSQTINWQGNTNPAPSSSRTDVVTFSIINEVSGYTVLGQLTGF